MSLQPSRAARRRPVNAMVDRLAAYSWRLIVIGIVVLALLWLVSRMRLVLIPIVVAVFLARALTPVTHWLRRHRWPRGLAAAASLLGLFALLIGLVAAVAPSLASELDSLGPTLTEALDDVEDWLVDDAPFDVSRDSVDRLRARTGDRVDGYLRDSDGQVLDSATLVAEAVAGTILAIILAFFMLRDGDRFVRWALGHAPSSRQSSLRRAADRGWAALGGYLRGAALLGLIESVIIGLTLFLAGGDLVAPVMVLTFLAAFVPLVGAIVAGAVAVLVALVTAGAVPALVVAIVALVVQQLDNDLLAPVIYGRALDLHPVAVLLSVAAGGALFGIAGTLLAVPAVAVAVNAGKELRTGGLDLPPAVDPSG